MVDYFELSERPQARYMIVGWRQWADAGSVSSGLPYYLVQQSNARKIGTLSSHGFYLFQIPGTHDLVRPVVKFDQGYPLSLDAPRNELFFTGADGLIFLGDEPHLDIERYTSAILDLAQALGVTRIISLGGVYGELPYNKERMISAMYSLPKLKEEVKSLAVTLTDYQGGASIGSYLCRRASEKGIEMVGFYAFVPTYDFSKISEIESAIRIENDFMAWLGVMRRINYMLKTNFDLADLEYRSRQLIEVMDAKMEEFEQADPELNIQEYFSRLTEDFNEVTFDPLADVWEDEIRRILDDDVTD